MKLLSIDPDTKLSWWALFEGKNLKEAGNLYLQEPISWFWHWKYLISKLAPDLVIIEGQYFNEQFHRDGKLGGNVMTFRKLVEMRTRVETVCEFLGIACEMVAPQTWQTAMLHSGRGPFRARREQRKKLSIRVALARCGDDYLSRLAYQNGWVDVLFDPIPDGLADAICIGLWRIDQMGALAKRKKHK